MCDRVAILVNGKVVHQGTIDDVTARTRYYEIRLDGEPTPAMFNAVSAALVSMSQDSEEPADAIVLDASPPTSLPTRKGTLPGGEAFEQVGGTIRLSVNKAESVQPVIDALRRHNLVIQLVRPVRQSLEEFFIATVANSEGALPFGRPQPKGARP